MGEGGEVSAPMLEIIRFSFSLHLHAGKRSMHSGRREKKRCVEERASPPPPSPPVAYWEFPPPFPSPLHLL